MIINYYMKIYDITVPLSERTPVYEGDPGVEIEVVQAIAKGAPANVTKLNFGAHTATHVDAPNHFIDGTSTVEEMPLDVLIGAAKVVEIDESVTAIGENDLPDLSGATRVLFKTKNSQFWGEMEKGFRKDFTYIEPEAAQVLVEKGIKLVGIDYLSVEKFGSTDFKTHTTLLGNGVVIIEGLDLREVSAGDYELICLPLKVSGGTGDGAPARAVLRQN